MTDEAASPWIKMLFSSVPWGSAPQCQVLDEGGVRLADTRAFKQL